MSAECVGLRDYQKNAIEQIAYNKSNNICLYAPTGAGKSIIILETVKNILKYNPNEKIVILVNISKLIEQLRDLFERAKINFNIVKAGMEQESQSNVYLVMQQTAHAREWGNELKDCILIQDEYHISYGTDSWNELLERLEPKKQIGLSATPFDSEGVLLEGVELIETTSIKELVSQNYLTPIKTYVSSYSENMDFSEVAFNKGGDYNETQLAKVINSPKYNKEVVRCWSELARDKKTIVFATGVKHAEALTKEFLALGVRANCVHSKRAKKDNDEIFEQFKNGEIQVLVSISMITTGFDEPNIECGIMCRPTQVLRLYLQCIGRLMRIAPNKKEAIWLDMAQVTSMHGLYDDDINIATDGAEAKNVKTNRGIDNLKLLFDNTDLVEIQNRETLVLLIEEAKRSKMGSVKGMIDVFLSSTNLNELIDLALMIDNATHNTISNNKTKDFIFEKWNKAFDMYPYKRNQWISAFKTRTKNIIKGRKKIVSLAYFIDFLITNMDNEYNNFSKF